MTRIPENEMPGLKELDGELYAAIERLRDVVERKPDGWSFEIRVDRYNCSVLVSYIEKEQRGWPRWPAHPGIRTCPP